MRVVLGVLVGVMWAVVLLGGAFRPQAAASDGHEAPRAGYTAPPLELQGMDGQAVRLSDYRGKAVFLNFWASWCGPCRMEMPEVQRLAANLPPDSAVLTVNMTDQEQSLEAVQAFLSSKGYTFPVATDPDGSAAAAYEVVSLPTSLFVSPDGVVTTRISGPLSLGAMTDYLKAARR